MVSLAPLFARRRANSVQSADSTDEAVPEVAAPTAEIEANFAVASQWQLMWWKFRRHKLAVAGAIVVLLLYVIAIFVEFAAPYDPEAQSAVNAYRAPTAIHFVDAQGRFHLQPFVYGAKSQRNPDTFELEFVEDKSIVDPIGLFVHGDRYKLWGLIPSDIHLFGLETNKAKLFLLGADRQGRDMYSRIIYGTRISMSIGLIGVVVSFVIGIVVGGISGYVGGVTDLVVQRVIEFVRSMPTIPLWLGLAAALPSNWSILQIYLSITIILSLIGWTSLAQVVRGRALALREEDFIMAARLCGTSQSRIIFRHMVPSFTSHIIAALTLAVPEMIIAETSLSFLGLGLHYPAISWGVLLQEAQNLRSVVLAPWLLTPGIMVVVAVLALNFLGDGLRDAADPYRR